MTSTRKSFNKGTNL